MTYVLRGVEKTRTKGGVSFTLRVPELCIGRGEFWTVVGPSGCGKSTLLDILALVLRPDAAGTFTLSVDMDGGAGRREHDAAALSPDQAARLRRRSIGYVLQSGGLLPFLTVRENILLTARLKGLRREGPALEDLARALRIQGQLGKKPGHLSGGQRQRVAIARALIHEPAIVLADEPTAAVDRPTAEEIRDELLELASSRGVTVVMVTHDRDLVAGISDHEVGFALSRRGPEHTVAEVYPA